MGFRKSLWTIIFEWWLFGGLAVLPFVYWPQALVPYEIPRVIFFVWWVRVLAVLLLAGSLTRQLRFNRIDRMLVMLVLGYAVFAMVASIMGLDVYKSVVGNFYRADGLVTLFHLIAFGLIVGLVEVKAFEEKFSWVVSITTVMLSCWVVVYAFLYNWLGKESVSIWGGPIGVSFGQPNFLAGYLLATLPVVAYRWQKSNDVWSRFWIFGMVLVQVALYATQARAAMIGIGIFWLGFLYLSRIRRVSLKVILIGLFIWVAGMGFWGWYESQSALQASFESRWRIVNKLWLGILERPWLGYGVANIDYAFDAQSWPVIVMHDVKVDKAHNVFLEVLVASGIVGLVVFLMMCLRFGLRIIQSINREDKWDITWFKTLLLVTCMYFFHAQTNVTSIAQEVMWWSVVGMVMKKYY